MRNGTIAFPRNLPVVHQRDVELAQRAATKLSNSLHRYLKRANRHLIKHLGREEYQLLCRRWRGHLLWVRIRLVYFRSPSISNRGRTRRAVEKAVAENIRVGLEQLKRIPPEPKKLCELAGIAVREARQFKSGKSIRELTEQTAAAQKYLGEFAISRCHPKRAAGYPSEQSNQSKRTEGPTRAAHKRPEHPPTKRPINHQKKKARARRLAPHRKHQHLALADLTNRERLTALLSNWANLDFVSQGDEIRSLIRIGCTQRGLAKELEVAPTTIGQRVHIAQLSEEHRSAIRAGASAKTLLEQVRIEKIEAYLVARFSRPEQRAQRLRELQDFVADTIVNFKISPRMYKELNRPILEFVRIEAQRLGPKRLPKPARLFAKVLESSEPPPNKRQQLGQQQKWIGTALARIEPDQALLTQAVTELLAVLVAENQKAQYTERNIDQIRVLQQLKTAPQKKSSLRGPAPEVPSRTQLNHPFRSVF
jgi:hypothetical protein